LKQLQNPRSVDKKKVCWNLLYTERSQESRGNFEFEQLAVYISTGYNTVWHSMASV